MKTILFFSLAGLLVLASCNNSNESNAAVTTSAKPELFSRLEGKWISTEDSSQYIEVWTRVNDSLYVSTGYQLQGTDTLFSEKVEIKTRQRTRQYIPQVNNQNGGQPVVFEITSVSDTSFIAENPAHDFPQRIVYNLRKDSLIAYIEGKTKKGDNHREYFRMGRK
jgi:hypothetical protein